jgi:hypothetical protein
MDVISSPIISEEENNDGEDQDVTGSMLSLSQQPDNRWLDETLGIPTPEQNLSLTLPLEKYNEPRPEETTFDSSFKLNNLWKVWKEKWGAEVEFRKIVPSYATNLRYRTLNIDRIKEMRKDLFTEQDSSVMKQEWVNRAHEPMLLLDFNLPDQKLVAFDGNHRYYAFSKDAPLIKWHSVVIPMTQPGSPSLYLIRKMAFRTNSKNTAQIAPLTRLE